MYLSSRRGGSAGIVGAGGPPALSRPVAENSIVVDDARAFPDQALALQIRRSAALCCMDQQRGAVSPRSDILTEANVFRPAKLEHPVQRGGSNSHLGRLPPFGP